MKKKKITFKIQLCLILLKEAPFEFDLPEFKLLTISSDDELSLNLDSHNYLKYIYFNKNRIHSKYNYEKINSIINNESIKKLSNLFYLELLKNDLPNIINYENSIDILLNICNDLSNPHNIKSYRDLLISKVFINLIKNNKGSNNYSKEKETEFNTIKNICEKIIENNINIFKELNVNYSFKDFVSNNIDKIYSVIIIELIKTNNFENYEYLHNLVEELDLESINITKTIYEDLYEILNKKEYVKRYIISDLNDLSNPIKINFLYFLLKYIFKSSFYIYQIPFLLNIRKNIINILKRNLEELYIPKINDNDKIKEKKNYVIKKLLDSGFYYQKYFYNLKYDHLKEILNKEKKENNDIEEDNKKVEIKEKHKIEENNKIENNSNLIINAKDKTILKALSEKSSNLKELQTSSSIIVQSVYMQDSSSAINFDKNKNDSNIAIENDITLSLKLNEDYINKGKNLFKKSSLYKIIEIIKVLDEDGQSDFFKNTSKGIYISGGVNKKLKIYNEYFEKKLEIEMKDWIYDTIEINTEKENEIKLLSSCNKIIEDIIINLENFKCRTTNFAFQKISCQSIFKIENDCIIIGGTALFQLINLFDKTKDIKYVNLINQKYRGGIQINKVLFAFTSNSNITNGEDKLIIYNYKRNEIVQTIKEYSFIVSSNGLCLIDNKIDENNKILLCACKKYKPQQKNGILLINLEINDDLKVQHFFYDTDDFEVNCFCQICNVDNNNAIGEDITQRKKIDIYKTEFVLVGGFDGEKGEGIIKLYKIKNNEKFEFLQDIEFEYNDNFNGFENSISCITQSNITGNIIVSCWDGNTYLLNPPNIDFYLK